MDEHIVSDFDPKYYTRAIIGAFIFLGGACYVLYNCVFVSFPSSVAGCFFLLIPFGSLWIYYYFFSKSWKEITVTPTEIIVYDVVFKKQTIIPYVDISHVGTYRTQRGSGPTGGGFAQNFVIEFGDNQFVGFDESWYTNYYKLTMAIYNHKYGPGHGRERYLERHQA